MYNKNVLNLDKINDSKHYNIRVVIADDISTHNQLLCSNVTQEFFFQIYTFMSTSAFIVHFFYAFVISPFGCLSTLLAFHKTIEMRGKAKHMAHSAP